MPNELKDTPARNAYLALVQLTELLTGQFSTLFRSRGLSLAQFNALRILVRGPAEGIPCQRIGESLVHRVPDVTRLVDRMERAGLVKRQRCDDDRRVVRVRITPNGRRLCEGLYDEVAALHEAQFESFSSERTVELDRSLRDLLALHECADR